MNGYEIAATIIIPALAIAASVFAVHYRWLKKVIKLISEALEGDTLTPEERAGRGG